MEKVKMNPAVAQAIEFVCKSFSIEAILVAHKRSPKGWSLPENKALNTIDYVTLEKALKYGYEVDVLPVDEILADVEKLKSRGFTNEDILFVHKTDFYGSPYTSLDNVDHETLKMLLNRPDKKTPHQMGKVKPLVKKLQKSSRQELELDLDYELASLHDAMQQENQTEVECCKQRLAEIHKELEGLG